MTKNRNSRLSRLEANAAERARLRAARAQDVGEAPHVTIRRLMDALPPRKAQTRVEVDADIQMLREQIIASRGAARVIRERLLRLRIAHIDDALP